MATVHRLLPTANEFYCELQERTDLAEGRRHKRFLADLLLQRLTRGYLIRKHVAWLSFNATVIQCAFRVHRARKAYRAALRRAVRNKHARHYAIASRRIQVNPSYRLHKISRASIEKICFGLPSLIALACKNE